MFCRGLTTPAFPLMVESTLYGEVNKRYELIIKQLNCPFFCNSFHLHTAQLRWLRNM